MRDVLARTAKHIGRSARDMARGRQLVAGDTIEEFWALKDVSFEIKRGEVVGIIGRNGAGKSTLLKILSRITEPSEGRVEIKGRVASLLEVGTGFHPELTGRENIYLNGAILGMTRTEIKRKFDEIVAFAEIEKFFDTPVKRYSSGMYVRLAFAVAAHLDPEILIIDEVLAVGDAEFQTKSLGKMREVAGGGRTVLFVSHNMGAIEDLSNRCLLLLGGKIDFDSDDVRKSTRRYLNSNVVRDPQFATKLERSGITFRGIRVVPDTPRSQGTIAFGKHEGIIIEIEIELHEDNPSIHVGYALYSDSNDTLWWSFFGDTTGKLGLRRGHCKLKTRIPAFTLNDGRHTVELLVGIHNLCWILEPGSRAITLSFRISGGEMASSVVTKRPGSLLPLFPWDISHESADVAHPQ